MPKNTSPIMPKNSSDNYRIIRNPRRRHIALRIGSDGVLEILSPPGVPETFLARLPVSERDAIARLRKRTLAAKKPELNFSEGARFALLGKFYPLKLSSRLRMFDGERFIIPKGSDEEIKAGLISTCKELAGKFLVSRCRKLQLISPIAPSGIHISSASTRWGSCNSKKLICLSWKLIQCPPELIDYVIIHELAHLQELNHSARFWQLVESYCPDYRTRRLQLKNFSRRLPPL